MKIGNSFSLFLILAALSVSVVSCSDDGGGTAPLDVNAGTLTARPGAANTPVTDENKEQVGAVVQSASFSAAGKGISAAFTKLRPGQDGLIFPQVAAGTSGSFDKTVNGTRSGNVQVKGSYKSTVSGSDSETDFDMRAVFNDYSDDGSLFMAGSMDWDLVSGYKAGKVNIEYVMKGAIRFNGAYEGQMTFDYNYKGDGSTFTYTMNGTFTSDGKTVSYSYTYPS